VGGRWGTQNRVYEQLTLDADCACVCLCNAQLSAEAAKRWISNSLVALAPAVRQIHGLGCRWRWQRRFRCRCRCRCNMQGLIPPPPGSRPSDHEAPKCPDLRHTHSSLSSRALLTFLVKLGFTWLIALVICH